jgi:hypothetical protein
LIKSSGFCTVDVPLAVASHLGANAVAAPPSPPTSVDALLLPLPEPPSPQPATKVETSMNAARNPIRKEKFCVGIVLLW